MSCYLCDDCQNELDEAIDSAEEMAISRAIQRIDRDRLALVISGYRHGSEVIWEEDAHLADAVLAALPDLMKGESDE